VSVHVVYVTRIQSRSQSPLSITDLTIPRFTDFRPFQLNAVWLTIENEYSAHAQKNRRWPKSEFLVLTKGKVGSRYEIDTPVKICLSKVRLS